MNPSFNTKEISIKKCLKCGHDMKNYAGHLSTHFVCSNCRNVHEFSSSGLKLSSIVFKKSVKGIVPVGHRGEYKKSKFTVIGILLVKESGTSYYWNEYYILYDSGLTATIIEINGHFIYSEVTETKYPINSTEVEYNDLVYSKFNFYTFYYVGAEGEFDFNVYYSVKPKVVEYIYPPYGLVKETKDGEVIWYSTEYIDSSTVKRLFEKTSNLVFPKKEGVASIQPLKIGVNRNRVLKNLFITPLVMFAILLLFIIEEKELVKFNVPVNKLKVDTLGVVIPSGEEQFTSMPFKVKNWTGSSSLKIEAFSYVENDWVELEGQLLNEVSGEEDYVNIGIEYYHGSDWSEGSQESDVIVSSVSDGSYRFVGKTISSNTTNGADQIFVKIYQTGVIWKNFWLILLAVSILPGSIYLYQSSFESNRWLTSNLNDNI